MDEKQLKIIKQRRHFKTRLQQRYGYSLNNYELKQLKKKIVDGEAIYLKGGNNGHSNVYQLIYNGRMLRVVYDWTTGNIVTALPID